MALTSAFGGAEGIRTPDLLIARGPHPRLGNSWRISRKHPLTWTITAVNVGPSLDSTPRTRVLSEFL